MPNKYRYSRSLVEEKIVFWLTLIFSLWFIYHLFTSNNYFTPSQSGLLIIGEVLVLFISWSFAYSPQKTFNSKVIHKKLTTNSYGWRRRRFYYHLSLDSGVDLLDAIGIHIPGNLLDQVNIVGSDKEPITQIGRSGQPVQYYSWFAQYNLAEEMTIPIPEIVQAAG